MRTVTAIALALALAGCGRPMNTSSAPVPPDEPEVKAPAEVALANQAMDRVRASKKRDDLEFTEVIYSGVQPAICGRVWGKATLEGKPGFAERFIYTPDNNGLQNGPEGDSFVDDAWNRICRFGWAPGTGGQ